MVAQTLTNILGTMGRGGDSMMGHLSHGDVVIPREIVLQNPDFLTKFKKAMQDNNADYRGHIAGSGYENHNPHTGAPEFFLNGLKNFFSNPVKQVSNFASDPVGGVLNIGRTGSPLNLVPAGNSLVNSIYGALSPGSSSSASASSPAPDLGAVSQPFSPKRPDAATQPFGLFSSSVGGQQFSTLDPTQQRSYLATQGSQGGGIGDEDKNYYLNLLQRNLIDENGQMQNMNSALLPVERNYLSHLGLPTDNTTDFFQALQT